MLEHYGTSSSPNRAGIPRETRQLSLLQAGESSTSWHESSARNVVFMHPFAGGPNSANASNEFRWHLSQTLKDSRQDTRDIMGTLKGRHIPKASRENMTAFTFFSVSKKLNAFLLHGDDVDLRSNILTHSIVSSQFES